MWYEIFRGFQEIIVPFNTSYFCFLVAWCLSGMQWVYRSRIHFGQLFVLPHWDRSCKSHLLSHQVTLYWHRASQSQHWRFCRSILTQQHWFWRHSILTLALTLASQYTDTSTDAGVTVYWHYSTDAGVTVYWRYSTDAGVTVYWHYSTDSGVTVFWH